MVSLPRPTIVDDMMQMTSSAGAGDIVMIAVYWLLTGLWVFVISITIAFWFWKAAIKKIAPLEKIMRGFILLSFFLFIDSFYWSLANTSRVGFIPDQISSTLYGSWSVAAVKILFAVAAVVFVIVIHRTFRQLEDHAQTLYFTQFADTSIDAIGVLDPSGKVLYWNKGAVDLFRWGKRFAEGKHIKEFLVPQRLHDEIDKKLGYVSTTLTPIRFRNYRNLNTREEIFVDITITPFSLPNGDFGGFFGILRPASGPEIEGEIPLPHSFEVPDENINGEGRSEDDIIIGAISDSLKSDYKRFERKQKLMTALAFSLLVSTMALLLLALLIDEPFKYLFGLGSILTLLSEFWPFRFFRTHYRDEYRRRALQIITRLPNIDRAGVEKAIDLLGLIDKGIKGIEDDPSEEGTESG